MAVISYVVVNWEVTPKEGDACTSPHVKVNFHDD
jgi:hypothetical protein